MSRARSFVFVMLTAALAMWPAVTYAESDIIAWLEGLSGPGPFHVKGKSFEQRLFCLPKGEGKADTAARQMWNCFADDDEKVQALFTFTISSGSTGSAQLFKDDPNDVRDVHQLTIETMASYRANRVIDVGGGVQFIRFSSDEGASFSFWRVGLTPLRLTLTPFGFLKPVSPRSKGLPRLIHLQFEDTLLQGISGSDFNNFKTTYHTDREFQARASILFDFAALLRAIHP